jgi:hypothetical protein
MPTVLVERDVVRNDKLVLQLAPQWLTKTARNGWIWRVRAVQDQNLADCTRESL